MRFGVAYTLTNTKTGDTYVGITTRDAAARWKEHVYKANGRNCDTWLHRAIRKYGAEFFEVQEIASATSRAGLLALEIDIIKDRQPTYNQSHGGEGTTGRKFTPEVLEARNQKLRGRKRSAEERQRISAACRKAMTPERRAQCAEVLIKARAAIDQDKRVEATIRAVKGRVWSLEAKAKLSASCMGRKYSQDVIDRMARAKMKAVICTSTNTCYSTAKEAAEALGVSHSSVIRVLKGRYPAVKGLAFKYGD
jgi:group I intron endonuclease